jgi:hypothetical protein
MIGRRSSPLPLAAILEEPGDHGVLDRLEGALIGMAPRSELFGELLRAVSVDADTMKHVIGTHKYLLEVRHLLGLDVRNATGRDGVLLELRERASKLGAFAASGERERTPRK